MKMAQTQPLNPGVPAIRPGGATPSLAGPAAMDAEADPVVGILSWVVLIAAAAAAALSYLAHSAAS
jgi:hypothetical protein